MHEKQHRKDGTPITGDDLTNAYLEGYAAARERAQHTIKAAIDESDRLRLALESALSETDADGRGRILAAMHRGK